MMPQFQIKIPTFRYRNWKLQFEVNEAIQSLRKTGFDVQTINPISLNPSYNIYYCGDRVISQDLSGEEIIDLIKSKRLERLKAFY